MAGLGHVRWLGGASGAGKTTVAARLADAFELRLYSTDATIPAHGDTPGPDAPLLSQFRDMDMDRRWLERDAATMLDTFPWFGGERFSRVIEDLEATPPSPLTVAEGFRLLPGLVTPLLEEPWQAAWLIPTPSFRAAAFERRGADEKFWLRTSDPATALERLLERDRLFADRVTQEAHGMGLKVITVDGRRGPSDIADEVATWFRLRRTTE